MKDIDDPHRIIKSSVFFEFLIYQCLQEGRYAGPAFGQIRIFVQGEDNAGFPGFPGKVFQCASIIGKNRGDVSIIPAKYGTAQVFEVFTFACRECGKVHAFFVLAEFGNERGLPHTPASPSHDALKTFC